MPQLTSTFIPNVLAFLAATRWLTRVAPPKTRNARSTEVQASEEEGEMDVSDIWLERERERESLLSYQIVRPEAFV